MKKIENLVLHVRAMDKMCEDMARAQSLKKFFFLPDYEDLEYEFTIALNDCKRDILNILHANEQSIT